MCYARLMVLGRVLLGVLCGLGLIASAGWADELASARIGRLSAFSGAVQYRAPAGGWSTALINEPVGAGVEVRSPRGGTVEIRIGDSLLALDAASELQFAQLDNDAVQIGLPQGRMFLHLAAGSLAKTIEIDLPGGGVWIAAPGDYDIVAGDAHKPARVQVFAGHAAVGDGLEDNILAATAPDAFDIRAWRGASDAADDTAHLPRGVTGGEALAANGDWSHDSTYGDIWRPKDLPVDWMPYRYGSWRYLPPWGWTWIDAAAWGFAPSHYGAWVRLDGRWAWAPGSSTDEPAYSPAVVGFLGTAGIGLSRPGNDGAAVAWFPLAPGERPDDPDDRYHNRRAASIVPRAVFAGGKPVQVALLELPEWRLDDAPVVLGALNIPPVGNGGTAFVAAADVAPVVAEHVAVVTPVEKPAPQLTRQARVRQVQIARIHDILMRAANKRLPRAAASTSHHWRTAEATPTRPRLAPSTTATGSTHNRQHLAAARGGAQLR
jgi:hypothetical protein